MDVLEYGTAKTYIQDVDDIREWMRDNKPRALVDKVMDEHEAVRKFVRDGYYLSYDLSSMVRGPMSLEREIIRQGIKNLWLAAKFTLLETTLLVAAGSCNRIDVGFIGLGKTLSDAVVNKEVETIEWSNGTLALRHKAGAMGVPFLPTRALLGTDTLKRSGAKVVIEPFTKKKVCLVPAVNPDVAVIHVNQCDKYGNARIFGPSVSPLETAQASKRVEAANLQALTVLLCRRQAVLRRIRRDIRLQAWLRLWLYVHVPLTIALLVALVVHILTTFMYW